MRDVDADAPHAADLGPPTETRRLGDDLDRLDAELDEAADKLAATTDETASGAILQRHGSDLDQQFAGAHFLVHGTDDADGFDGFGPDATITVSGISAGDKARITDRAEAIRAQRDMPGDVKGAKDLAFTALGLEDAPFLPDTIEGDPLDTKLDIVSGFRPAIQAYLKGIVNDVSTLEQGNCNSLRARLAARSTSES